MLLNKRFSDSQLVEEIKAGNEEALVSMQKSYYAMVKSFILKKQRYVKMRLMMCYKTAS